MLLQRERVIERERMQARERETGRERERARELLVWLGPSCEVALLIFLVVVHAKEEHAWLMEKFPQSATVSPKLTIFGRTLSNPIPFSPLLDHTPRA